MSTPISDGITTTSVDAMSNYAEALTVATTSTPQRSPSLSTITDDITLSDVSYDEATEDQPLSRTADRSLFQDTSSFPPSPIISPELLASTSQLPDSAAMEHNDPMFQLGVLLAAFILSQRGTDIGSHQTPQESPANPRSDQGTSRRPDATRPHMVPGVTGSLVYDFTGQMFNGRVNSQNGSSAAEQMHEGFSGSPTGNYSRPHRDSPAVLPTFAPHTTPRSTTYRGGGDWGETFSISPRRLASGRIRASAESYSQAAAQAPYPPRRSRGPVSAPSSYERRNESNNVPPLAPIDHPLPRLRYSPTRYSPTYNPPPRSGNNFPHLGSMSANSEDRSDDDEMPPLVYIPDRSTAQSQPGWHGGDAARQVNTVDNREGESDGDEMPPLVYAINHSTAQPARWARRTRRTSAQPLSPGRHGGDAVNPASPVDTMHYNTPTVRQSGLSGLESMSSGSTTDDTTPSMPRRGRTAHPVGEPSVPLHAFPELDNMDQGMQRSLEMMTSTLMSLFGPASEANHAAAAGDENLDSELSDVDSHPPPLVSVRSAASRPVPGSRAADDDDDDCPPLERVRSSGTSVFGGEFLFDLRDQPPPPSGHAIPGIAAPASPIPEQDDEDYWTDEDDYFEGGQHAHIHGERRSTAPSPHLNTFEVSINEFGHTFVSFNPFNFMDAESILPVLFERPADPLRARQLLNGLPVICISLLNRLEAIELSEKSARGAANNSVAVGDRCCSVCFEPYINAPDAASGAVDGDQSVVSLPCRHLFHKRCLQPWFERCTTCPNCRFDIDPHSLTLRHGDRDEPGRRWSPPPPLHWQSLVDWIEERERALFVCTSGSA